MNVITRGMRGALRSPVRSGAIIAMLAISVGLILAMLVARNGVNTKINEVKATTATAITINPAGIKGGMGGGEPLTADHIQKIKDTDHISKVTSTLIDQLGESDTSLTPSFELGGFGKRMTRFQGESAPVLESSDVDSTAMQKMPAPRTTVTGTTDPSSIAATLTSGTMIDGNSSDKVALVGKTLAEKNSLSVGDTFTAYGQEITVKGIFSVESVFENNGLIMPLSTLQTLTEQPGAVTNVAVTVDSSDHVVGVVSSLKDTLGDKIDVVSQEEQAANSLAPLESIASLALAGVIGASVAGATIVLLAMIMVVRERRREIGVIKAIGASNIKVITQFMTEGMTLTVIGGIIGIALGIAVSNPITQSLVDSSQNSPTNIKQGPEGSKTQGLLHINGDVHGVGGHIATSINNITGTLTPQVLASSVGIVVLITIIGSAIPAWAIARIRPAEVLRTE